MNRLKTHMKMTQPEEEKPILGTKLKLRDDFPYVRAWSVMIVGSTLYIVVVACMLQFVSQYVMDILSESTSNITTENTSHPCNGTVSGSTQMANQKQASELTLYYILVGNVPAVVVNVFIGSLSDSIGRRIVFVLPIIGIFLKSTLILFIVKFDLDLNFMYLAHGIDGLCGAAYAILVAVFVYIADVTVPGNTRTIAITVMQGCLAIGAAFGQIMTGYLISSTGYFYPILMCVICSFLSLICIYFFLPETLAQKKKAVISPRENIKMVFGFYFTEGTRYERCVYSVLLTTFFFSILTYIGRLNLETIYQLGEPFCWDSVQIGFYGALGLIAQFGCSILAIKVLQSCIPDEIISVISTLSTLGGFILEALAVTSIMMYLVPIVGVIGVATTPIARSLMSKMTPPNKQGAMFASVAISESVGGIVSLMLYNMVYAATVEYYQGAVWFLMAGICGVNIGFLLLYIWLSRRGRSDLHSSLEVNIYENHKDYGTSNSSVKYTHVL